MAVFLAFAGGTFLGIVLGITMMCLLQINRERSDGEM